MKNFILKIFIILLCSSHFIFCSETLGIVTKSKGKVEYQKFSEKKFTTKIYKGLGLHGDDRIRTGDNGFSIYRYLDDASSIKILKNSDIHIEGRISGEDIVKTVEVDNGILNFDIDEQSGELFTVVTPTSLATVKGTDFWLICNGPEGDKFFGVEGEVEIKNVESGKIVTLQEESVVVSTANGNIVFQNSNAQDLDEVQNLEEESGSYEDLDIDTDIDDSSIDENLDEGESSDSSKSVNRVK